MIIGIVGWVVVGLLMGFIASRFVNLKGDDPRLGIALGAVGGLIGGWLYSAISGSPVTAFNLWSLIFAAIGAIVAAAAWHILRSYASPVSYQNRRGYR